MNNQKQLLSAFAALALVGCPGPSTNNPDSGTPGNDSATPMVDSGTPAVDSGGGGDCATYCTMVMSACSGDNTQYASTAECMSQCAELGWPTGTPGATSGNTLACRLYHAGVAAAMPALHCPHAGASGGGVCGTVGFRTEASTTFTRVDRMGMPAVSTALVSSANKDTYNDENPSTDATLARAVSDFIPNLTALHTAIDSDITTLGLTPCSMSTTRDPDGAGPLPAIPLCVAQSVAPSVPVAALVIPDTLQINPATANGFPNGRRLADPVIDVTLAVILLNIESATGCGGAACTPATLAGLPLNPGHNDATTTDTFPFLAAAHAP